MHRCVGWDREWWVSMWAMTVWGVVEVQMGWRVVVVGGGGVGKGDWHGATFVCLTVEGGDTGAAPVRST